MEDLMRSHEESARRWTWRCWLRNLLIRHQLRASSTPASQLFDGLQTPKRIMIAGLDAAGKTTFLNKYLSQCAGQDIVTYMPTSEISIDEVSFGNARFLTLDLGGGRRTRPLERRLVADMDAVIWILDSGDRDRMVEAREELQGIVLRGDALGRDKPVLFLAHKQDLPGAMKAAEIEGQFARTLQGRTAYIAGTDIEKELDMIDALKWLSERLKNRKKHSFQTDAQHNEKNPV